MPSYSEIAATLSGHLHLAQPPIAVCLTQSLPPGIAMWSGQSPAGCRFWQEAAERVFATTAADHRFCAIGQYTHNLDMSDASRADLADAFKIFADLTYVREQDLAAIPVLDAQPNYVIYGPLAEILLDPDVVLLFVEPSQQLILAEASQQLENGMPPAMGRPACAIIPQARNTGRSALSLGCCGARAYVDSLANNVALYAVPGATLSAFAGRIAALTRANETLTKFHQLRRAEISAGASPSVRASLAALESGA